MKKTLLFTLAVAALAITPFGYSFAADGVSSASTQTTKASDPPADPKPAADPAPAATSSASTSASPRRVRGHGSNAVAFSRNTYTKTVDNVSHASSAIAQLPMSGGGSSVTLFGELDAGITVKKIKHKSTRVEMSNGNWYWTSWGIKGMEALGNGNSAIFTIQQAFAMNNGKADGSGFNNQVFVGFQGPWGRLTFGRQAGLSSGDGDYSILGGSALTTGFTPIGNLAGVFITSGWQDNSIAYRTQDWNGLQFTFLYSNGTDDDTNKWSKNEHYYGFGLTYDQGAFNSNLSFELQQNKRKASEGESMYNMNRKTTQYLTMGASYDFGSFTLYGAYQFVNHAIDLPDWTEYDQPDKKGAKNHGFSVSVATDLWGGTLMLQGNYAFGKAQVFNYYDSPTHHKEKYNIWSIGTGYTYPLSKRTLVYASVNYGQAKKYLKDSDLNGFTTVVGMATTF